MISSFPLWGVVALFASAAVVILFAGIRMTGLADRIADRTGFGEAVIGGVMLGAATSVSGLVVSVSAAHGGQASLAFSNGVGGIAAQTAFLAFADITHRRANLEHAAADVVNVFQAVLLMVMLVLPVAAFSAPEISFWSVHPVSAVLVIGYVAGVAATTRIREQPMWRPVRTAETRVDQPEDDSEPEKSAAGPILAFLVLMAVLGTAGWVIERCGVALIDAVGISGTSVGALLTAVATSLPELVTTLAAVRRGALQLAVGGIIGGNVFDTLFLTASDIAYRDGSLFHAIARADLFWLAIGLAMTGVLVLGLVMREKQGPGGIGFESVCILGLYGGGIAVHALSGAL